MPRRKRPQPKAPPPSSGDGRDLAFYSAVINAWIATRMEKDKSLLTLSAAGIGLLVTLLTTVGIHSRGEIPLYALGFVSFLSAAWTAVRIFDRNADYLGRLAADEDVDDPTLGKLDKTLQYSFGIGIIALFSIGILSAQARFSKGDPAMTENKKRPSLDTLQKSLNNLNTLKNDSGGKTQASVDGLHKLKPGPAAPSTPSDPPKPKK